MFPKTRRFIKCLIITARRLLMDDEYAERLEYWEELRTSGRLPEPWKPNFPPGMPPGAEKRFDF